MYDIRSVLRAARYRAGFTQQELAAASGTAQAQIARYESGAAVPTFAVFDRLLAACRLQARFELERRHADLDREIEQRLGLPLDARPEPGNYALGALASLIGAGAALCVVGRFAAVLHGAPLEAPSAECLCREQDVTALHVAIRKARFGAEFREDGTIGFFELDIRTGEWPADTIDVPRGEVRITLATLPVLRAVEGWTAHEQLVLDRLAARLDQMAGG